MRACRGVSALFSAPADLPNSSYKTRHGAEEGSLLYERDRISNSHSMIDGTLEYVISPALLLLALTSAVLSQSSIRHTRLPRCPAWRAAADDGAAALLGGPGTRAQHAHHAHQPPAKAR